MMKRFLQPFRSLARRLGFDIVRFHHRENPRFPPDFSPQAQRICRAVLPFTMTSPERISALLDAVTFVTRRRIPGAFVECGVWKGGSVMAMALALLELGDPGRDLYLYDTFSGMSQPGETDVSYHGAPAADHFRQTQLTGDTSSWCRSPLEEVQGNINRTGYPQDKVHYVQGKVEDTLPAALPGQIALLRLDTDWYESTRHELLHLYPLLQPYGVLILDDYGHWQGARRAADEFLQEHGLHLLLHRVDYTGRIAIKLP